MSNPEQTTKLDFTKRLEHGVKNSFAALIKVLLKKGRGKFAQLDGTTFKNVLFLRPETKLGDMVISLPIIDRFKEKFRQVEVSILCSPRNLPIIKNDPRFAKIYLYSKSLSKDYRMIKEIRKENFDCIFDLLCDDSVTALVLSQLASKKAPRIGVGKIKYAAYYDFNRYNSVAQSKHIINNTMHLLDVFGEDANFAIKRSEVFLDQKAQAQAKKYIDTINEPNSILIGVNLSAGSVTRRWAEEKTFELLNRIKEWNRQVLFVLISTPKERDRALIMAERIKERVSIIPDKLSIVEVSAILKKLNLLISPDTSLVHIARSFDVPVLALYPGHEKNIRLWRPFGQEVGFQMSQTPDNVFDITVDQMYTAFIELVESRELVRA